MNEKDDLKLSTELEELLKRVPEREHHAPEYLSGLYTLMCAYEAEGNIEGACGVARDLIDKSISDYPVLDAQLRTSYDVLARAGDFESYCIALEWNRPLEKKFYIPRAALLKKHGVVQLFQDLQDDKLDLAVLNLPPRIGKALSDDTPVLTRRGWKNHGDLVIGDYVLNHKGQFVKVQNVSDKCDMEYKVTFSNGESINCHGNHEWVVYDRHIGDYRIIETKNMIGKLRDGGNSHAHYRFLLPEHDIVNGEYAFLPVDPYTLGAWLGDGTNTNPYITGDKKDRVIPDTIALRGYPIRHRWVNSVTGAYTYDFDCLRESLQCLGMCHSRYTVPKHIPEQYLVASIQQRLELLAGLLDTDGTLRRKKHRYSFTTCDELLRDDFVSLVNTFGWRTSVVRYEPRISSSGIAGRKPYWVISFNPTMYIPCMLERKQLKEFSNSRRISIVNIEKLDEEKQGNCIQVEGGVYLVGRQLIPTHNSTMSLFFITFRAGLYPDLAILGNGHSTSLTQSFYKEFLDIVTSEEYRFAEIFPRIKITTKNSEYSYVDFNADKRFHTVMFRSIEGGTTGLAEASNLLYCDDLVKDVETANSKDRLDKLYYTYTSTVKDRKIQRLCKDGSYRPCPELHVNTPWSIHDVTSRIVRTEGEKGNDERTRVVSIPCWDENHESNFMYDFGKGFDVKYYEDMQLAEDPVIFSAKYLMKPIERDGRPFEKDALTYYTELPEGEPDLICAYNDVSHGGDDYMSMPIAYVYGYDVYINDVLFIHNFDGDSVSRPLVCKKLVDNEVTRCGFEKNNGGDFYATLVSNDLKKVGYRCNVTMHNAPTNRSKLDRILGCADEIKGTSMLEGTYRVYFRDPNTLPKASEYREFLLNLWNWSQKDGAIQKKQHDDAPDSIAGLLMNVLGKRAGNKLKLYDITKAGY